MKTELMENVCETAAELAHEANRAYCIEIGDFSQKSWEEAPDWQKASAKYGVDFVHNNPTAGFGAQHESWLAQKVADGWVYGEVKDEEKKTHPCCVPYEELPEEQKVKDMIFRSVVNAVLYVQGK